MNKNTNPIDHLQSTYALEDAICKRIPFWLNSKEEPLYCWLHIPKNRKIYKTGVVICNPLGYEYTHSHRTVRHMSDRLAAAGYANIRFDYYGTGDSFSDLFSADRVKCFLNNIDSVICSLKELTGVSEICLTGLRLGAALAASYCENNAIDKLVLCSPCIKGRSYVREMRALSKLASHTEKNNEGFIDSGGFILTEDTANELEEINLLKQNYKINKKALIIERDDFKVGEKLPAAMLASGVKDVEVYAMSGYADMMAEPHATIVPEDTLTKIVDWLDEDSQKNDLRTIECENDSLNKITHISKPELVEEICYQENTKLLSILSHHRDLDLKESKIPLIILANSGSVHRVGPNRVYVELARGLALAGYPVLRFDLRNLGDSVIGKPENENHPFPYHATEDIANIIEYMKKHYGFKDFIVSGLCSGAHNAFHAGLELPASYNIREIIIINPLTFYRKPGFSDSDNEIPNYQVEVDAEHYKESVYNSEKWKKLLSGKVDLIYLSGFVLQKIARSVGSKLRVVCGLLGCGDSSRLSLDLNKYAKRNLKISFFIASKDPGKKILMHRSSKTVLSMIKSKKLEIHDVPEADHTFSAFSCREEFVRLFIEHIKQGY
jgi:alpha-beta hydrolase superfamily lysophospholipase